MPVGCIHARHVHAAVATQLNKTDTNDARGIAQLTRSGWYRGVDIKSMASHEVRLVLCARGKLVSTRTGLYNQIQGGLLKKFGVILPAGKGVTFERLGIVMDAVSVGMLVCQDDSRIFGNRMLTQISVSK
ncbi:IS110 family transposase [Mycetohabitans sp. B46]|uniref:IS110 family transposase n=1 Tax=Mycetohabitans sp. B46 TaxID=2772536 RepID=UPI00307F7C0A